MSANPYKVPEAGIEYNEFVGPLGPYGNGNPVNTELHVRYGVRGGRYYDWTINLVAREGDINSFRATHEHPVRYVMESVGIEGSAVVKRVRTGPGADDFEVTVVKELSAGDGELVDYGYNETMKELSELWDSRHEIRDPHTIATFGFAAANRDPEFRDGSHDWVRDTVVCIDDDQADDVIVERLKHYFFNSGTVAVHCRSASRLRFLKVGGDVEPGSANIDRDDNDEGSDDREPLTATGFATMGMLVDTIGLDDDWIDDTFSNEE